MFLPADSQNKFKIIADVAALCIDVKMKLAVVQGFGDGAELWKSASREASLTELMRVVVRGVALHHKAPADLAPIALPFAGELFATAQSLVNDMAHKLVEHYHARAMSSYEDVTAANGNDPLLSALCKLPDNASTDAILEVAKANSAKFEPSGLQAHLKRAAEDIPCQLGASGG